jgi:hypothetical protein
MGKVLSEHSIGIPALMGLRMQPQPEAESPTTTVRTPRYGAAWLARRA